jgi:integrase
MMHRCSASTAATASTPVNPGSASATFHRLAVELAFPVPDGVALPHLHCLRHTFAVGCLLRWYREGLDPSSRLLQLSTFMGHVDPTSTGGLPDHHAGIAAGGEPPVRSLRRARMGGGAR